MTLGRNQDTDEGNVINARAESLDDENGVEIAERASPDAPPSMSGSGFLGLQGKPTTALSLDDSFVSTVDDASSVGSRSEGPTLTFSQGLDVAKLLSEVLASPSETPSIYTGDASDTASAAESSNDDGLPQAEAEYGSEIVTTEPFLSHKTHFFILSAAGKPIFSLNGTDEDLVSYMGVLQTIVSYFDSTSEQYGALRSFRAGDALFVVRVEGPIILAAIDRLGRSEPQLDVHLGILYAQILSTMTKSRIQRMFEERPGLDLRQQLAGTEVFLRALTTEITNGSPSILLSALECLRLHKSTREKINNILLESRTPSLLYGLIAADSRLVSVIRPRKHSLHPPDIYLIFSMLFNTGVFKDGEHWVPICLPKFNSTGFLYAYVTFIAPEVALVLISPQRDAFYELRDAHKAIHDRIVAQNLLAPIQQSVSRGRFKCIDIPAPMIRHFLYKSKANVQFVMPSFEPHFYEPRLQRAVVLLYHQLHAEVHRRQYGAPGAVKILHSRRQKTTALAWTTPSFELYCVANGTTTKAAMSSSVRSIISWIKSQEARLFVVNGAVF